MAKVKKHASIVDLLAGQVYEVDGRHHILYIVTYFGALLC